MDGMVVGSFGCYIDNGFRILFSALGGYKHNTVCSARTVDGCCRCILEDGEAFDGFGWQTVQVVRRYFDAVEQDKGLGSSAKG